MIIERDYFSLSNLFNARLVVVTECVSTVLFLLVPFSLHRALDQRDCLSLCEHAVAPPPAIQPPSGHFEVLRVENDQCGAEVRTENTQWDVSSQTLEYKT